MAKTYARAQRIGDLVLREVAQFLQKETNDPRLQGVSITAVKVTPDKSRAHVYFTVLDSEMAKEIEGVLKKAAGYFRTLLARSAGLRYTPSLHFQYDASILHGAHLSQLIDDSQVE
jgi:ribosome-binding factor A